MAITRSNTRSKTRSKTHSNNHEVPKEESIKEPSERESFDNFLDYKDDLEKDFSISLNTNNRKAIYEAVIDELRDRKLVNKKFYENEKETISFLGHDETFTDIMCMFLFASVLTCFFSIVIIIITVEFSNLAKKNSFNMTLTEL